MTGARAFPSASGAALAAGALGVSITVCAQLLTEAKSISAPRGSNALSEAGDMTQVAALPAGDAGVIFKGLDFLLRARTDERFAKMASKNSPRLLAVALVSVNGLAVLGLPVRRELAGSKLAVEYNLNENDSQYILGCCCVDARF